MDHRPFRDFGFHFSPLWTADFVFGLVLGAVLMMLIFACEYLLGWVEINSFFKSNIPDVPFYSGIISSFFMFFLVSIYEETFSRGYQLRNLAEGFNLKFLSPTTAVILAYIVSSSFFGLLHAGNPNSTFISTFNLIITGLFLGLGIILTGNLSLSIGIHITWNFFQGNVFGFPVSGSSTPASFIAITQKGNDLITGGKFGPEAGLIGLFAVLLGCVLIFAWVFYTRHEIKLKSCLADFSPPGSLVLEKPSTDADAD
ncbi:MAG: CPBP family intramembrane metalloprotease [Anaerolineae bacterium]|nr:CPBP family intramembrane metalloprotease [Anaerolineae bacterium]